MQTCISAWLVNCREAMGEGGGWMDRRQPATTCMPSPSIRGTHFKVHPFTPRRPQPRTHLKIRHPFAPRRPRPRPWTYIVEPSSGEALGDVEGVERAPEGEGPREPAGADEGEGQGGEDVCRRRSVVK